MLNSLQYLLNIDLPSEPTSVPGWNTGGYHVAVILFVILLGGLAAGLYYFKRSGMIRSPGKGQLEVLETRPLGGRQFLVVGKYGAKTFLLGVCPGRIDYLSTLEDGSGDAFDAVLQRESDAGNVKGKGA